MTALLWVVPSLPAQANSDCDTVIRVLLRTTEEPLKVSAGEVVTAITLSGSNSMRIDGRSAPVWRSEGASTQIGDIPTPGPIEIRLLDGKLAVIAEVPLEEYVEGVLHGEMPALWDRQALMAQAVVSRTYALHQSAAHAKRAYDLEAGTRGQVFRPTGVPNALRQATAMTHCQVLVWREAPILAVFHSASGGRTASAEEVWGGDLAYLVSMDVKGEEDSPDTYWRTEVSRTTLGRALEVSGHRIGSVEEAVVKERSGSGRVLEMRFRGTRGTARLSGRELRTALGASRVRSTLFKIDPIEAGFLVSGSGSGHGVGMSQWGARSMARKGALYTEILGTFYPGTELKSWGGESVGPVDPGQRARRRLGMEVAPSGPESARQAATGGD